MRRTFHTLCRTGRLLLAVALLTGTSLSAQDYSAQRSLTRHFAADRERTLEVHNKYGKIEVVSWDRDSVLIEVDMEIRESSSSRLRKLKDDISVDFNGEGPYIIARTRFKSENNRLSSELKSISHTLSGSNKHVEINYRVHAPVYMNMILENKFGDIFLDDLDGKVNVVLSNGAIQTGHLKGKSQLKLNFANGMIKALETSDLELTYSDISMGSATRLDLESKSSTLRGDSINVLNINSRRDKLYFKQVEYFTGNSSFSEVWVYDFIRETDVYMRYGKLNLERVDPRFSKIYVESDYTDIRMNLDSRCRFSYDILHHDRALVRLPEGADGATASNQGEEHLNTTGIFGSSEPEAKITINALQKCFINLSIR